MKLFLYPSSRMHFISKNIQTEMRFGLSQTQSELLQLIKQTLAGWEEKQQTINLSTLATVDTRWRARYPWVAWHLSQRDSLADLGGGGGSNWRQTGWLCLCFPLRLIFYGCAIKFGWQIEMTESQHGRQEFNDLLDGRECSTIREWGWNWEMC